MTAKSELLRQFSDAFARGDIAFFADKMTDDVTWTMAGESTVSGKDAVLAAMESMSTGPLPNITIKNIITHGADAAVHGSMWMDDDSGTPRTYVFCDVYRFSGFKNPKIKEVTSFVVETQEQSPAP